MPGIETDIGVRVNIGSGSRWTPQIALFGDHVGETDSVRCVNIDKIVSDLKPQHVIGVGDYEDVTETVTDLMGDLVKYSNAKRIHSSPGNHDVDHNGDRVDFNAFFDGGGYRKVTVGIIDFFIYDSYLKADESGYWSVAQVNALTLSDCQNSTQGQWLLAQLAASTNTWKVVVFHQPSWSSGDNPFVLDAPGMRWDWAAYGVDLVVTGHEHFYERFIINTGSGYVPHITLGPSGGTVFEGPAIGNVKTGSEKIISGYSLSHWYNSKCAKGFVNLLTATTDALQVDIYGVDASFALQSGVDQVLKTKLLCPSGLTATVVATGVQLDWTNNAVTNDKNQVWYSSDNITFTQLGANLAGNAATYTHVIADTNIYYYKVRTGNGALFSNFSNTVSASSTINFVLTKVGTGAGVANLQLAAVGEDVIVTLDGAGYFYTDAGGTANQSQSWTVTKSTGAGTSRSIYIKVTTGTSNLKISRNKITKWGEWASIANCPSISGDISKLTLLNYLRIPGASAISGNISGLTALTYINISDANTITGDISGLILMTSCTIAGVNTVSGSIAGWTVLQYCNITGNSTMTYPNVTNITGLCYLLVHTTTTLSSANVNQLLADFWANRNAAKGRAERIINIAGNAASGAPSGQGATDKTNLGSERSPNPPGTASLWTVTTR